MLTDEHGGTANIPGPRDLAALEKQVRSIWNFFDLEAQ